MVGIGAVADLEVGGLLDLLLAHRLAAPELDVRQDGHLANAEDQDVLAALGRSFSSYHDLNVGEPLGAHQALDVGLDLLLVERLAGPAQELRPDLLGGDRGVAFDPDLRDGPLGKPIPLLSTARATPGFRTVHRRPGPGAASAMHTRTQARAAPDRPMADDREHRSADSVASEVGTRGPTTRPSETVPGADECCFTDLPMSDRS